MCENTKANLYCQECAEVRASEKVGSIYGILSNALRYLDDKDLVTLGKKIADRTGHSFLPNEQREGLATGSDLRNQK